MGDIHIMNNMNTTNTAEEVEYVKCKRCKTYRTPDLFINDKGRKLKTCHRCREVATQKRIKNKCEHNRQKSRCKECGGVSICEHNRQKNQCKECGGSNICEHNRYKPTCKECGGSNICEHKRIKNQCKECGGSSICEHNRKKSQCKECGGSSICEHNRIKNTCKECGGSNICEHNRQKQTCKECGGSNICEHNRQKYDCKECGDPIEITITNMIKNSYQSDRKRNRYDANNFIDKDYLRMIIDIHKCCIYCKCELQFIERNDNMATVERINNDIGHTKVNTVIACFKCNSTRGNRHTHDEFLKLMSDN